MTSTQTQDAARLRTLLQLSQALNEKLDLPVILERVVQAVRDLIAVSDASIMLWDARRQEFETAASTTTLGAGAAKRVRRHGGASRWIVDNLEAVVVADTAVDPFVANRILSESKLRSYAGVPLERDGQAVGILYALDDRPRDYGEDELRMLRSLASIATVAIHNARHVRALRRASELRETMMRLAAHDLRAPLSTMMAYLELLESDIEPRGETTGEWLRQIWRAMARMQRLIGDVLDYARLTDQGEIAGEPVDLADVVDQALARPELHAGRETHRIRLRSSGDPAMVEGDPLLLREMVANLLDNALKHTPEGSTIDVLLRPGEREHVLVVADDGPGIAPADHQRSFEPFVQLTSGDGSGLGLSLVRTIVERHRGHVRLESDAGRGATFTVTLPALRGSRAD